MAGVLAERVAANEKSTMGNATGSCALAECVTGDESISGGAGRGTALLLSARLKVEANRATMRREPVLFRRAWPRMTTGHEGEAPEAGVLAERVAGDENSSRGDASGAGALCADAQERRDTDADTPSDRHTHRRVQTHVLTRANDRCPLRPALLQQQMSENARARNCAQVQQAKTHCDQGTPKLPSSKQHTQAQQRR